MRNKPYFLALNHIPFIGPRTVMQCLKQWPFLGDLFKCSSKQLQDAGFSSSIAQSISTFDFSTIEADLRWEENQDHFLLTWDDPHYPSLLKEIHDPPPVIYAKGDLSCFEQMAVAMVGTRKPSVSGYETAWHFAYELASNQITIVSGLALGIDARAHLGCLEAQGKTIAVMGTGIDRIYPQKHRSLAEKIAHSGLLISEFPLKTTPKTGHFPRRNRIISGLSLCTLVVEAAFKSGSLITARLAMEQGRDVLAIPGSVLNPQARGCHYLIQEGAKLVTSTQDILDELNITNNYKPQKENILSLASELKNLVKCIGYEITTIDQIIKYSELTIEAVSRGLATLEIEGIIQSINGGYVRCK